MAIVNLTAENYEQEVKNSDKPVIIDFWAPWCGPCKMMAPVFEKLSEEYAGKMKFAKCNVDEEQSLPQTFGVQGIPTLFIIKNGEPVAKSVGMRPEAELKQFIEANL
ncbi:thioredoxin [Candidatus Woesearchaeota archaeon]|nr:MAG: thioredoxin [Candidatus Woesearchaeota archaeon]